MSWDCHFRAPEWITNCFPPLWRFQKVWNDGMKADDVDDVDDDDVDVDVDIWSIIATVTHNRQAAYPFEETAFKSYSFELICCVHSQWKIKGPYKAYQESCVRQVHTKASCSLLTVSWSLNYPNSGSNVSDLFCYSGRTHFLLFLPPFLKSVSLSRLQ